MRSQSIKLTYDTSSKIKRRVKMKNEKDEREVKRSWNGGNEKYRAEIESTVKKFR